MFRSVFIRAGGSARRMCTCTSVCYPRPPKDPAMRLTVLNNGIRVATEFRAEPFATVALVIEAGSRYETAHNNGITNLIEHMAYKGFTGAPQPGLDHHLRCLGMQLSATTRREQQVFIVRTLPENVPNALDVLARIVTELDMDPCLLELEKYNIYMEMKDADRNPRQVCFDYLHQTAFQGTPLAQSVAGTTANVEKFDRCFACEYLTRHYQPYKLCIVSSGFVEHHAMVGWTDARMGHLVGDGCCVSDDGPCRFTGSQIIFRDDSLPFAHVAIAFETPGYSAPEHLLLYVAKCLLGNWDSSRGGGYNNGFYLARVGACAHFCERYETFYLPYRDVGLFGVYFVGHRLYLEEMMGCIQDRLMHLCHTLDDADVQRGVNQARLAVTRRAASAAASVRDIGTDLLYTCGRPSLNETLEALARVDKMKVMDIIMSMMEDRSPALAAVGPTETLPDFTRICAGQYWLRN